MTKGIETGSGYCALCADDDPITCAIYDRIFTRNGFETRIVDGGIDVLGRFVERPADIVILDVQMRGMSGIDVVRTLRGLDMGKYVPIIIMSGHAPEELAAKFGRTEADLIMQKPLHPDLLIEKALFLIRKHELLKRYMVEKGVEADVAMKLLYQESNQQAGRNRIETL